MSLFRKLSIILILFATFALPMNLYGDDSECWNGGTQQIFYNSICVATVPCADKTGACSPVDHPCYVCSSSLSHKRCQDLPWPPESDAPFCEEGVITEFDCPGKGCGQTFWGSCIPAVGGGYECLGIAPEVEDSLGCFLRLDCLTLGESK